MQLQLQSNAAACARIVGLKFEIGVNYMYKHRIAQHCLFEVDAHTLNHDVTHVSDALRLNLRMHWAARQPWWCRGSLRMRHCE